MSRCVIYEKDRCHINSEGLHFIVNGELVHKNQYQIDFEPFIITREHFIIPNHHPNTHCVNFEHKGVEFALGYNSSNLFSGRNGAGNRVEVGLSHSTGNLHAFNDNELFRDYKFINATWAFVSTCVDTLNKGAKYKLIDHRRVNRRPLSDLQKELFKNASIITECFTNKLPEELKDLKTNFWVTIKSRPNNVSAAARYGPQNSQAWYELSFEGSLPQNLTSYSILGFAGFSGSGMTQVDFNLRILPDHKIIISN